MKPKKTNMQHLKANAVWLIMHPCQTFGWEMDTRYPWLAMETIRLADRIRWYTQDCKHQFVIMPEHDNQVLAPFSQVGRMSKRRELVDYMKERGLQEVVYTGFHHGICILSERELGMQSVACIPNSVLYLKQDLVMIGPGGGIEAWGEADRQTQELAHII